MPRIRSATYRAVRVMGDVNAIRRGPRAVVKRAGRKVAGRLFGSIMGRLLR